MATRTLRCAGPLDLVRTLAPVRRGGLDPSTRLWPGTFWWATRTPDGPATLLLEQRGGDVDATGWGPGAAWVLEQAPHLLGLDDDVDAFDPRVPMLHDLARRYPGIRFGRTGRVAEALAPTVIEQKVTSGAAHRSWASLVRRFGEQAPGPMRSLVVPPAAATLATTPSWVFHRLNVERRRADTVCRTMARAVRLEETCAMPRRDAYARLQAFSGVGVWTAAEVAAVAWGDPDAVSVGDYHLKHHVCWALAGEPRGTDERMLELLEPWAGHRGRVVRLLLAGHPGPSRRGPRMPHHAIAAI